MATIQERNRSFRILFLYKGKRRTVTLGKISRTEAETIDLLLLWIKQGRHGAALLVRQTHS